MQPSTATRPPNGLARPQSTHPRVQADPGASIPAIAQAAGVDPLVIDGEYLCIPNVDRMPPFLMSVASDSNFWLFVGSNGGFTAGRVDPDHAVFPYQTADKILSQPKASGVVSLMMVDGISWDPWTGDCPLEGITRNLYKHVAGTSVIFEEINQPLGLAFRWELTVSEQFGLVRQCHLENLVDRPRKVRLLDGWNHLLPSGVTQETYSRYSYLASAYMRHEVVPESGLGIYTLNSGITDRAEPCEALRVSCAWSLGLDHSTLLLSDRQVDAFRRRAPIQGESEARGVFGAHLRVAEIEIEPQGSRQWILAADTGLDHTELSRLEALLREPEQLEARLTADLSGGVLALKKRIAGAGAIQQSADSRAAIHHFANVLFNCMRGGTLHDNYSFPCGDFAAFLKCRNGEVLLRHQDWLTTLPDPCTLDELNARAARVGDPQLARLAGEYLPICFSRRHGDPSRPWNRFEIHTKDSEGMPLFAYAGNWRDIFQNWESLAYSYPACFEPMIAIFLNASTADGYNPYRITRAGIDWEVFDASDPWSHIGYWGDHQIIYLLRLLEGQERFQPGRLTARLNTRSHTYAHVPYEIAGFDELRRDPKNSIVFNESLHQRLIERAGVLGGDGKLLADSQGEILLVTLAEKLLLPLLVKLSNLVPGGGIWLNTQRPEWNDANNALAGWGLSVVTVCYMRRYVVFLETLLDHRAADGFEFSLPVAELLTALTEILPQAAASDPDDESRARITEALGRAGEKQRAAVYTQSLPGFTTVSIAALRDFMTIALAAIDATLQVNRREKYLFHSYNLLELDPQKATVHHLDLMLEGQVAGLSSGALKADEALGLLGALRASALYRADQHSYLLYPDRKIQPFLGRNTLPELWAHEIPCLAEMIGAGDRGLIHLDDHGRAHFHPDLTNARDLNARLDALAAEPRWQAAIEADRNGVLDLWEQVFRHRSFTGRSGSMFAFEGLGSIYWHMVAKLLLALQEVYDQAVYQNPNSDEAHQLAKGYDEIRTGLGFTKDSGTYGAFPTDPYSHSPRHRGAQQPGMTGQVKEEILTRMGELGVHVESGCVRFAPTLLQHHEFFTTPYTFSYIDIHGQEQSWDLGPETLGFTAFQVPVCYALGETPEIVLGHADGRATRIAGNLLSEAESRLLFDRKGEIRSMLITLPKTRFQPANKTL